jgi:iron uptake system component EfeO
VNLLARPAMALAVVSAVLAAGCGGGAGASDSGSTGSDDAIAVDAGDTTCEVAATKLPAGRHTFAVSNSASQVTEVYVYASGDQVVGEVENIGPGTTRDLTVDLSAGAYEIACKPGMVGDGNRTALTVTDATPSTQTLDK